MRKIISECILISDELVSWQKTLDACEVSKIGGILLDDSQQFTHHPVHKKKHEVKQQPPKYFFNPVCYSNVSKHSNHCLKAQNSVVSHYMINLNIQYTIFTLDFTHLINFIGLKTAKF